MSWREQLRVASFRGAAFKVDASEKQFGRRVVIHEYPGIDLPETEDLGQRPEQLSLRGYVLGDDYFSVRDALSAALEQPGVGRLVHPYFGELDVVLLDGRLVESKREGGLASFDLVFLRAAELSQPAGQIDTAAVASQSATVAAGLADQEFLLAYSTPNPLSFAAVAQAVTAAIGQVENLVNASAEVLAAVKQLANTPQQLAARLRGSIARIGSLLRLSDLFQRRYGSAAQDPLAQANALAMAYQVQVQTALAGAQIVAASNFASLDEATAAASLVLGQLDQVSAAASPVLYQALATARADLWKDVSLRSANLARIAHFTPAETTPALVLAHRLYGPALMLARSEDLIARNRVAHPGFVPGGQRLEVLSS